MAHKLRSLHISLGLPLAAAALAATIFAVDTITTVDLAFGALYVCVVLLAARFCRPSRTALVAAGCVGLTIASYVISPHGDTTFEGVANTLIGVVVIGLTALLVLTNNDIKQRLRAAEALRDMQSQLAHANRVSIMGQLTASIAHEVAQPIAAAGANARAGLLFLGKSPPGLEEAREALRDVVDDMNRGAGIIGRIRDHIKRLPPRQDSVDLNRAVLEVIGLTRSEMVKHGISIKTNLTLGLPPVQGDLVQLQQVVLNLVLNGAEAMNSVGEGERNLSISTEQTEAQSVRVAVCDSGPGIDPEQRERIFDPFYTTKSSGLGMGLSICRSIIDNHGGRLWATVNEPRGAVFQFILPTASSNISSNRHRDVAASSSE